MYGYRKLAVTFAVMAIATVLIYSGTIDQDTFKWLMASSGVAYLAANSVAKFVD
jgi:hypothetical protein